MDLTFRKHLNFGTFFKIFDIFRNFILFGKNDDFAVFAAVVQLNVVLSWAVCETHEGGKHVLLTSLNKLHTCRVTP